MKFGAHMSTSGGFYRALQRGSHAGCDVVQIFVKNNMRWMASAPPSAKDIAAFAEELKKSNLSAVFGHTGYLINIAAPQGSNYENSLKSLVQEIEFAAMLGIPFLVLHPGAHVGQGEEAGLVNAAQMLDLAFEATSKSKVRIALENTAGQGSCLGSKFEHIAAIYDKMRHPKRLGMCIDTAHLFAAGFDIRTAEGWDGVIKTVDRLVGIKEILAFHLNDSKTALGSKVDRHEDIGKGQIGAEGFRNIVTDSRFKDHPGCLETHKSEDLHEDIANLATLRELAARPGKHSKPASSKKIAAKKGGPKLTLKPAKPTK